MAKSTRILAILALSSIFGADAFATKLLEVRTLDEEHLMVRFADGFVHHEEGPRGEAMYQGHESRAFDRLEVYGLPLNTTKATEANSFTLQSVGDLNYAAPLNVEKVYRKTKVSGTAWKWPEPDLTYEHTLFIKLPKKLQQGQSYTLTVDGSTNTDTTRSSFKFDVFESPSEALHLNIIGMNPDFTAIKAADLYAWMGDGGARDYSGYVGKQVYLVNTKTKAISKVGQVKFWQKSGPDCGNWNYTQSDVWTCDFSAFKQPGTYRLAVEGVGCSPEFKLEKDVYFEPFKTSVRGFYYMRIGEPMGLVPPPRQPRFIPGKDPVEFKVIRTTYSPWHPDWKLGKGDQWDVTDWSKYAEPGNPTNPNAYGGHSDALDWDRHLGHVPIIWDLLLPYLLSNGKCAEDDLGIRESKNGIPDLLDEAQNEVDFWLRLRDGNGGYATGLNNPNKAHTLMYQAASRPYMAWMNAASAAMMANAFKIAKQPLLVTRYVAAAKEAWKIASEQDLDEAYGTGNGVIRGRDLKMMAAAALYNCTGDKQFQAVVETESAVKSAESNTEEGGKYNQQWAVALCLMNSKYKWQPVVNPTMIAHMRDSIIREAINKQVVNSEKWPSRRSADPSPAWFQTIQEVQKICIAHSVATESATRDRLLKALILEADWGLGRNPMNMVQMTGLGSRHADFIYTSGRNDGVPGSHPGHTPYMNAEPWGQDFMGNPRYYASRGYPAWEKWPQGEALWRAPYCYSNNEFTPQQSMRGKMCLLGYLYTLGSPKK